MRNPLDLGVLSLVLPQLLASPHPKLWATESLGVATRGGQETGSAVKVVSGLPPWCWHGCSDCQNELLCLVLPNPCGVFLNPDFQERFCFQRDSFTNSSECWVCVIKKMQLSNQPDPLIFPGIGIVLSAHQPSDFPKDGNSIGTTSACLLPLEFRAADTRRNKQGIIEMCCGFLKASSRGVVPQKSAAAHAGLLSWVWKGMSCVPWEARRENHHGSGWLDGKNIPSGFSFSFM